MMMIATLMAPTIMLTTLLESSSGMGSDGGVVVKFWAALVRFLAAAVVLAEDVAMAASVAANTQRSVSTGRGILVEMMWW